MWNRCGMLGALMQASLLAGCANTIVSQVTAFRQPGWQDTPPRTYAFDHAAAQPNDLERLTYEAWTSAQLAARGFSAAPRASARYLVRLSYATATRLMRVRQPVYPDPYWGAGHWGPWHGPWGMWAPRYAESSVQTPLHTFRIEIDEAATGQRVYQVTSQTQGGEGSLTIAMPYLIRSALANFPAQNAQPTRVELPLDANARLAK